MKKKNKIIFILLTLIGIITSISVFLTFNSSKANVIVATQTVRGNVPISSTMLTIEKVDKAYLPENYILAEYADELIGKYTDVGFAAGQILSTSNVATNKKTSIIPKDYTLLSVDVDNFPEGLLAGDKINIVIGTSLADKGKVVLTFQNILITNVYTDIDGFPTGLEIQVKPEQAQKIVYAQLNGELSIALLPVDYSIQSLPILDEEGFASDSKKSDMEDPTSEGNKEK